MIIILGLIILVAAVVVGVAGVLGNGGSAHTLSHVSMLGYHLTGSAGTLFLSGIVVGAAGLLGLSLLLAGTRRTARRGSAARRGLKQSRRETAAASQERDELIQQRDSARADSASDVPPSLPDPSVTAISPAADATSVADAPAPPAPPLDIHASASAPAE